jgi:very-short-patch-repair endonuclease
MLKIINRYPIPTKEASDLKESLKKRGVQVYIELDDGYKHIDLAIPKARLNIEVDGIKHLTDPNQIVADLGRGYFSHKKGYNTMHIPNEMIHKHLEEIADALAEATKIRAHKLHIRLD